MANDGIKYEQFCCRYLEDKGYSTKTTVASGDQGVDIVAEKDGILYAVQCKYRESGSVGNDAVQQVAAGKNYYDCDIAIVMTNVGFSSSAVKLAEKLRVRLWDSIVYTEAENDETDPVAEIEQEVRDLLSEMKQNIYSFESCFDGHTNNFVSIRTEIDKESDKETDINSVFLSCGLITRLIKKYTILKSFSDIYYYEIVKCNDLNNTLYKIALKLSEMNMVIERTSDRNIVVAKRRVESSEEFKVAEQNKHKNQLLADKIINEFSRMWGVKPLFLVKGKKAESESDVFLFYTDFDLTDNQIKLTEKKLNDQYQNTFCIRKDERSLYVSIVKGASFSPDEEEDIVSYSDPCGLGSELFVSCYSNYNEKIIQIQIVLANININDYCVFTTGEANNREIPFLWYDMSYFLTIFYEVISCVSFKSINLAGIEPYVDVHGIPLMRLKNNCVQLRVLDKRGNIVMISENTDLNGLIYSSLAFNSFLLGDIDRGLPVGSGIKRIKYFVLDAIPGIVGDKIEIAKFNISDEVKEIVIQFQRILQLIEDKKDIILNLFHSFSNDENNMTSVSVENKYINGKEITHYYKDMGVPNDLLDDQKRTFSPMRNIDYNPKNGATVGMQRKIIEMVVRLLEELKQNEYNFTYFDADYRCSKVYSLSCSVSDIEGMILDIYETGDSLESIIQKPLNEDDYFIIDAKCENVHESIGELLQGANKQMLLELKNGGFEFSEFSYHVSQDEEDEDVYSILVFLNNGEKMIFEPYFAFRLGDKMNQL